MSRSPIEQLAEQLSEQIDAIDFEEMMKDLAPTDKTPQPSPDGSDDFPAHIFVIPVKERPFFPSQHLPVILDRDSWEKTFEAAQAQGHNVIGLVFSKHPEGKQTVEDFYSVGTLIRMREIKKRSDHIQFVAQGLSRFTIKEFQTRQAPFQVSVEYVSDALPESLDEETKAYALAISNTLRELLPLNPLFSEELRYFLNRSNLNNPAQLADFAASVTTGEPEALQDLLSTFDLRDRLEKTLVVFRRELEVNKIEYNIRERVEESLDDQQREFFLRQQLKEIQNELGIAKDDRSADQDQYSKRLKNLKIDDKQSAKIEEEIDKLSFLEYGSPEYNITRTWLDWVTLLPWGKVNKDKLSLSRARKVLDKGHHGLDDVKDRILEFLAVGALKGEVSGSILLLVGPPGVGKTSIGRAIADTLGRSFFRLSVGGMRDEAEIKGHRRTYIGAMPGKFVQALKETGQSNPVILLDEIDKIGTSYQGDPAAALLEVLDPEQNKDFLDHYLDLRFDLSKALFICTANTTDTIPSPLLDRMEEIRLPGYITEEKIQIAKQHLWPSILQETGLERSQVQITEAAIRHIIEGYAREAGVRNLKKKLAKVLRKMAMAFVEKSVNSKRIGVKDIEELLGIPVFHNDKPASMVGVVTGLAWTSMGGATLNIEAANIHTHNRGFKLSGQLGDVMKESAEIAYSYISSNLKKYQCDESFYDKAFIHVHVPDGATPKDGPSAGITIATALLSLAKNQKVQRAIAMTGELSLTGQVLPVGGIREKVIAARRVNIFELILPDENRSDYEKLPDYLKAGLTVHFAKKFEQVKTICFDLNP